MITNEINQCLKGVKGFVGTFPCNEIPFVSFRPAFYVVNTARLGRQQGNIITGKHWVAIMLKVGGSCEYFDSFGMVPSQPDIVDFVGKACKKSFIYNTQMLQDPLSRVCGVYCVDYIFARTKGLKLRDYIGGFNHDYISNDKKVVERVTCLLSTRLRSLRSKIKTLLT